MQSPQVPSPLSAAILAMVGMVFINCGGGSGSQSPATANPTTRTIQGRSGSTQIYGTQETRTPTDLSAATISALTPSGNTYLATTGTGAADGTFTIPAVPTGSCFVKIQIGSGFPLFYQVDGSNLELEGMALGDPSIPVATQSTTWVTVDPAAPGMVVSSADLVSEKSGLVLQSIPVASGLSVGWKGRPLLNTSRETDLIITGLASAPTPAGDSYNYITGYDKSFITPFALVDGATNTISANLVIQGTPSVASASVDRDAFCGTALSSMPASNPSLTTTWGAQPLGANHGPLGQVRLLAHTTTTLNGSLNTGSLPFGDPFPVAWTRVLRVDYTNPVPVTPPGSTNKIYFQTLVSAQWRATEVPSSGPLKPIVGPATNYRVNGLSLMQPQTGVGITPLLAWGPPALGTAACYTVTIFNLTRQASVASFLTTRTSLQVPPQLLIAGEQYLFWLGTASWPGFDLSKPKAMGWPNGRSALISEIVVP